MDAPAIYALVDVLARIEIDMQTGRSSFAKVNERHAMLCPIPEATADATCRCARVPGLASVQHGAINSADHRGSGGSCRQCCAARRIARLQTARSSVI